MKREQKQFKEETEATYELLRTELEKENENLKKQITNLRYHISNPNIQTTADVK